MLSKSFRLLFPLLLIFMSLAWTRTDAATASFHESFDSFDEALWGVNFTGGTIPSNLDSVFRIATVNGTNYLNLQRLSGGSANAFVYWKGNSDFAPDGKVDDFELEIVLRLGAAGIGSSNTFGLAFRMDTTAYNNTTGYYLYINATGKLILTQNPSNHTALGTVLQETSIPGFAINTDYTLKLRVEGSQIEANLWAPNGTEAVASLLITNAQNTSAGYFGLRTGFGNPSPSVFYRDLDITAIPEPSQLAAAALVAGVLLFRKKRIACL